MKSIPELIERLLDMMGRKPKPAPRPYRALKSPCADGKTHRWEARTNEETTWRVCHKCGLAGKIVTPQPALQPEAAP